MVVLTTYATSPVVSVLSPFQTLFEFPTFLDGLRIGFVLAVAVAGIGLMVGTKRRGRRAPLGLAGPAWVLAALACLGGWFGFEAVWATPDSLVAGLAIVFVAGEIAERTPNPKAIGVFLGFPGALLIAVSEQFPGPSWSKWVVFGTAAVGGPLAADLDRRVARLGFGPVLWLVAVGGLYGTVPDTELVRPLIGAAIPLALTGWPLRATRMGAGGISAAIGLFVWVAAIDGYGRPGSIVGAVAALGLFVVEPFGRIIRRRVRRISITPISRSVSIGVFELWLLGGQLMLTWYGSRIAGFSRTAGGALLWLIPALPIGLALGAVLGVSDRLKPGTSRFRSGRTTRRIAATGDRARAHREEDAV